jgi:hypothetical protein
MPDRFILDPSMLLHQPTLTLMGEFARQGRPGEFVVPGSFLNAIEELREPFEMLRFFAPEFDQSIPEETLSFVRANRESFEPFHSPPDDSEFYRGLISVSESEYIARILFEEWKFMNTESLLFARARRSIDKIVEAGSAALALPRRGAEYLIRRTLRLSDDASISTNETLRAAAKWVALGGPTALLILEPISGTLINAISGGGGLFLYFDP